MSYSIDRLRAVSLENAEGDWMLEVEELVRINRNTFRPRRRRLSGRDSILQHLVVNQGALVGPTTQIIDAGVEPAPGLRFEIRGGGWVPAHTMEEVAAPEPEATAANTQVSGDVDRLTRRLANLEILVQELVRKLDGLPEAMSAAKSESGSSAGQPEVAALGETVAGQELSGADAELDSTAEASAPEESVPQPDYDPLKAPAQPAILDLVRGLVGDSVGMSTSDPNNWELSTDVDNYLAALLDDAGEPIGALVMDLEATVRLAGGMLMEEEDELAAQIEDRTPSEDIIDAAGEVLNTLTSAVNKVSGNAHVRAGGLQNLKADEVPWLAKARAREDFQFTIGGRLSVLSR